MGASWPLGEDGDQSTERAPLQSSSQLLGEIPLKYNHRLASTIATILSLPAAVAAYAADTVNDAPAANSDALSEIVVTAQRRSESIQNVPITVQAFSSDSLQKLNITTFDDMMKYLPNVTAPTNGPGQGGVYMRGLSTGATGTQQTGSVGAFPNVAIYLDEQSGQLPGRNLDIYAADLERVEVLEGPQGTLFGGGAEAGVIRYITNKPKLNVTEGNTEASYGITAGGKPNTAISATLNLPVIPDTLALRGVIYNDRRGGYINNVPSTFTRQSTDLGIHYANYAIGCSVGSPTGGVCPGGAEVTSYGVPPGSPVVNNNAVAHNAINPVTYQGARLSALYQINDEWDALVTQTYQDLDAAGVFYQEPFGSEGQALPKQSVTIFADAYNHDKFENTAITINGKIGVLRAVYAGSYLVRNVEQQGDYTNYARGVYADYYQCYGPGTGFAVNGGKGDPNLKSTCLSPISPWREIEKNTHLSQELRLSTPDDWRIRSIAGVFWEDQRISDQTDWFYKSIPNCTSATQTACMTNVAPPAGTNPNNPGIRPDNDGFFNDIKRGYKQLAEFASVDFDLVPQVLTLTAGARHFKYTETEGGSVVSSFNCFEQGLAPCLNSATSITAENLSQAFSGTKSRVNLTWHVTQDAMLYYTWSQGYRPGGFNRRSTCHLPGPDGANQYCLPSFYTSDALTNNELGWKTELFDRRLQFNGAVYQENWNNAQVQFFDPGALGNLNFITNGQNYRVRGVEISAVARVTHGLTLQGSASWNSSEQTNSPYLVDNNPKSVNYGKPITSIPNPFGPVGSPSANSPPIQFNLLARYEWILDDYNWFVQAAGAHVAHSFSESGNEPSQVGSGINTSLLRFELPPYTTYDASVGVSKDQWSASLYGQNITNANVSVYTNSNQFILAQTIIRPRVLGVKIAYRF
jgi:outer membrane receptor protein involved in Fe transport